MAALGFVRSSSSSSTGSARQAPALLQSRETTRRVHRRPRCRLGRQPAVSAPTPDCCIDPAICESMNLPAGAAWAAVLLGEAKQQRHAETARCLLRPVWPHLEQAGSPRSGSSRQHRSEASAHLCSRPERAVSPTLRTTWLLLGQCSHHDGAHDAAADNCLRTKGSHDDALAPRRAPTRMQVSGPRRGRPSRISPPARPGPPSAGRASTAINPE